MNKVNVFGHKSGPLGKTNKVTDIETGLQLVVENSGYSTGHRSQPQVGHFNQVAFDTSGQRFLAADHLGHFYLFDLHKCRFEHVLHSRHACTALSFALRDRRQILAAFADCAVRLLTLSPVSAALAEETAALTGHESAVNCVSVHCGGRYALTTDPDVTLLWDVDGRVRLRRLSVREDVQLLSATFVPGRNLILTAFRDDSLFLWDSETLQCRGQLPTPPAQAGAEGDFGPRYRSLDATPDGRQLVACGRTRQLHVWDLDALRLTRVLELPPSGGGGGEQEPSLCPLRQVAFASADGAALLAVAHSGGVACVSLSGPAAALTNRLRSAGSHVTRVAVSRDRLVLVSAGQLLVHCLGTVLRPDTARAALSARAAANAAAASAASAIPWPVAEPVTDRTEASSGVGGTGRTYTIVSSRSGVGGDGTVSAPPARAVAKRHQHQKPQPQQPPVPAPPQPLNRKRLRAVLQEFGQFPAKYRLLIWKTLLQLPENAAAFTALHDKGVHPAYLGLLEKFPLRSNKLARVLQRTLSCVAFWSPLFGEADYLPLLTFPFVKMFQNSQLHAAEVAMTVLTNWCGHWFEYFPNPPLNILAMVENLIAYHDKELYAHLCARGVTSEVMAWPLLQTLLTEVLTRDEWLAVWDCLLCQPPGYLLYCVAGFTLVSRGPLLRATELREFETFYRQPGCVGARDLVRQARQVKARTPPDVCPCRQLPGFAPLGGPQYPMFNRYPVFIVDYQVRERERLRDEERRYLEERRALESAQRRSETQRSEEAAWCRQQELLLQAEERRREMMSREETGLREQRRQLADQQRRARLEELAALTAQRQRLRALQSRHREVETRRMEDELERRRVPAADDLDNDGNEEDDDFDNGPLLPPPVARRDEVPIVGGDGGAAAGRLLSELEGVCQDNGQLEAEVSRLLGRLQAARERLDPTTGAKPLNLRKAPVAAAVARSDTITTSSASSESSF